MMKGFMLRSRESINKTLKEHKTIDRRKINEHRFESLIKDTAMYNGTSEFSA